MNIASMTSLHTLEKGATRRASVSMMNASQNTKGVKCFAYRAAEAAGVCMRTWASAGDQGGSPR